MIVLSYDEKEGFGELHIKTNEEGTISFPTCHYEFTLSLKPKETTKDGLVRVARDILKKLA